MKLLALVFLVGFALASAVPVPLHDLSLKEDDLEYMFTLAADDEPETELGKKLNEHLEEILAKIKDAIEHGKTIKEDTLTRLKEIREKLKEMKLDMREKTKELLKQIGEKARDYWQKIWDRLTGKEERSIDSHAETMMMEADDDDIQTELGKKLKEHLDEILEKMKDAIEHGKSLREDYVKKVKEIREKLKDLKIDLGDKAKELIKDVKEKINNLKDKAKDYWQKILDQLTKKEKRSIDMQMEADEPETEIGQKLKEHLDEILAKIKDAVENGKTLKEETLQKLKEIRQQLKDKKIDLGEKAKELLKQIREKAKDYWQKILDKLAGKDKRSIEMHVEAMLEDDRQKEIDSLQERMTELLQKIKEKFENGEHIRMSYITEIRNILSKLKKSDADMGTKATELVEKMMESTNSFIKKFLENIFGKKKEQRSMSGLGDYRDLLRKLRDKLIEGLDAEKIKAKIEELFGKHSDLAEDLMNKMKDKAGNWKDRIMDFIDKHLPDKVQNGSIKETYEKIKEYLKNLQIELKEKFVKFGEWAKDKYEKGLEKGKNKVENIKKLAKEFLNDADYIRKDVAEQAKEFFKDYKEDLGTIYDDLNQKIREILSKN